MTVPAKDRTRYLRRQTKLTEADTGFSRVRRRFQKPLWLLASLVGLLLVIGCGTIANMMLSRTLARGHELSCAARLGPGAAAWSANCSPRRSCSREPAPVSAC